MDHQTLVFDISSDEEFPLDNSSSADNFDWISKLLVDEDDITIPTDVSNGQNHPSFDSIDHNYAGNVDSKVNDSIITTNSDDDDDVVVVGEVIAKPRAKRSFNYGGGGDDDDCVVLEFDPDKRPQNEAVAVMNDDQTNNSGGDEDDLVVVGEKGQVACRDFPHSRHLCANFPFSSTPHESRCDMCHCYVCDSLAPCAYWGSGALTADHCNATDKGQYWQLERKKFKQLKNLSMHVAAQPHLPRLPHPSARPKMLPNAAASCGVSSPFGVPNIISQCRSQRAAMAVARNQYQPHLVSCQLSRTVNSNVQSNRVVHPASRMIPSRPGFKRSGHRIRPGVVSTSSHRSPHNVSVAYLSGDSSPRMIINNSSCPSRRNRFSSSASPQPFQGHGLPSPQTPTSRIQGFGQSPSVGSDQPFFYPSLNQTHSISSPIIPSNTSSALNNISHSSQQHSLVTQNIPGPDSVSSWSDVPTGISLGSHQHSSVTQNIPGPDSVSSWSDVPTGVSQRSHHPSVQTHNPCSASIVLNNAVQSSYRQPSTEVSIDEGLAPMHGHLPSVEQDLQTPLDFDFESWLPDNEPDRSFLDMSSQPSVTAPIDPGMLYFDFDTSWQGLSHT